MKSKVTPAESNQAIVDLPRFSWFDLLRAVWFFVGPARPTYTILLASLSLIFLYEFVPPWAVGRIVDELNRGVTSEAVRTSTQLALFVGASYLSVAYIRQYLKNRLGKISIDVAYRTRVDGFARLMDYSFTWHQAEHTGSKMQRITSGVSHIRSLMTLLSREILAHLIIVVGSIVIISSFGGGFIILALAFGCLFVLNEAYFQKRIRAANNAYNQALEKSSGTYYESAANILTIKSMGTKKAAQNQLVRHEDVAKQHAHRMRDLNTAKWRSFQSINGLTMMTLLLLVISRVEAGTMTAGTILVLFSYLMRMTKSAGDAGEITNEAIEHYSAIERMMPIFWNDLVVRTGTKKFPADWQTIEINDGNFRYRGREANGFTIQRLNLTIHRGEKIGVVGVSGSGKSTLAKLLLGLYDLEDGQFTIGDHDYYAIKHEELAKHITTVLQETEMFNASLADNITLFREVDSGALRRAVVIAQLQGLIQRLPEKLQTEIGEKGYKLSGGERQRVGIARAIVSQAEILILDEATAALDSKTEQAIQIALEKELKETTMLVIAHRLSTLKNMDRIIVFENGRIVEEGTFAKLLATKKSRFGELYRLQSNPKSRKNGN